MGEYIDSTVKLSNATYGKNFRAFRNANIISALIGDGVSVGDDSSVVRCKIGNNVAINRRSYINDSTIGNYSYAGINTTINFTNLGNFCSLARNVDIGGFDHDYAKVTTMPEFRFRQLLSAEPPMSSQKTCCNIGSDVWVAAGAIILHKVNVGDGAVIGAGSVVTKDVPPYAIVVGNPARIIKYRFSDEIISELLEIKWWDWPEEVLNKHAEWLINTDVDYKAIEKMKDIRRALEHK